jgi:hypothetical protein
VMYGFFKEDRSAVCKGGLLGAKKYCPTWLYL